MYRNIIIIFVVFAAIFNISCGRDDINIKPIDKNQVEITVKLDVPKTRAVTDAQEKKIDNLRIFVFDKNGNFAYSVNKGEITTTDIRIKLNLSKNATDTYKLVFVGNMKSADIPDLEGKTLSDLRNQTFDISDKYPTYPFRYFPMWGETENIKIEKGTNLGTINMLRAVASVDVSLNATNTTSDPPVAGTLDNFTLKSVRVYNNYKKGLYAKSSTEGSPNLPTGNDVQNAYSSSSYTPLNYSDVQAKSSIRDMYLAESENKGKAHLDKTCLVIGGYYGQGNKSKESFYRVDFKNFIDGKMEDINILRNHRYLFNITNVRSEGFPTADEAFRSEVMNMDVNILQWDNGNVDPIKYNGRYMLSVSKDDFKIFKEANNDDNKNHRAFKVKTTFPKGWTADVPGEVTWLSIDKSSGSVNSEGLLQFTATENDTKGNREAIIAIKAGSLNWNVKIVQTTRTELKLEILDENDKPIKFLELPDTTATKKLKVRWVPRNIAVGISRIGEEFNGAPEQNIAAGGNAGLKEYEINAAKLSGDAGNPFPKKLANIKFSIADGDRALSKTIVLKQELYNALPFDDEGKRLINESAVPLTNIEFSKSKFYFMDGSDNSFSIQSNAPYKVELTNVNTSERNRKNVVEPFTAVSKIGNMSKQSIRFKTVDDRSNPTRIIGYADFKISSTDPNKHFRPKTFRVKTVTVKEVTAESNSHIIRPNGIGILIPVTRALSAHGYANRRPKLSENPNTRAQLVWTDNSKGMNKESNMRVLRQIGKGENAKILVVPGSHIGNALIAMKEVGVQYSAYWSWHIWNTDYTPDASKDVMDRNLGALATGVAGGTYSYGLLYQWGRKSPFMSEYVIRDQEDRTTKEDEVYYGDNTNDSNSLISTVRGAKKTRLEYKVSDVLLTLAEAVKKPDIFVKNSLDWMKDVSDAEKKALWGHGGDKSISDPCPYGWRVPDPDYYKNGSASDYPYDNSNYIYTKDKGVNFVQKGGFYPFVDHILDQDATYEFGREVHGWLGEKSFFYWTNAYGNAKTKVLDLENDSESGNRVHILEWFGSGMGFPVRCVRYYEESNSAYLQNSEGEEY